MGWTPSLCPGNLPLVQCCQSQPGTAAGKNVWVSNHTECYIWQRPGLCSDLRILVLLLGLLMASVAADVESDEFEVELCEHRGSHWRNNQHNYIFSGLLEQVRADRWRSKSTFTDMFTLQEDQRKLSWTSARSFCRKRCMDLISLGRRGWHRH